MEDTLRAIARFGIIIKHSVLILVLMEDTLRVLMITLCRVYVTSLNPCFNGRYS